jgi:hypothetical protein
MFAARDEIVFSDLPGSLQRAHEEAFYWFSPRGGGGLMYPRLKGKLRTQVVRKSLFWFKANAAFWMEDKGSVVYRARRLAEVISDAGCEIRELETSNPGTIIWEDLKQVLALPDPGMQWRAF